MSLLSRHVSEFRFAFLIEPPFCYRASDGSITGCDVELARRVLQEIGVRSFVPVETEFAELLSGLADRRWDMTTGLFITEERRRVADFSRPIWALPDGLLICPANSHGIVGYSSVAQTATLRLAVVRDQVQHSTALRLGVSADHIQVFDTYGDAAAAVTTGTVDAFASVAMAHRSFLDRNSDLQLSVVEFPTSQAKAEQGAFAFAKAEAQLRCEVDDALAGFLGSTEHRALMTRSGFSPEQVDQIAPTKRQSAM
jgi:polar amino acid transport system substrate-binding protein